MDHPQAINRYRQLLVLCILLIVALSAALFQAKTESNNASRDTLASSGSPVIQPQAKVEPATQPLFRIGQQRFSYDSLATEFQQPLYQIQKLSFEQQMLVIEQAMIETVIYPHGKAAADPISALKQQFPDIIVTDAETEAYYQQNRDDQTPLFKTLRPKLAQYLLALKYETAKRELLTRLLIEGDAQVLLDAPVAPLSEPSE